MRNGMLGSLPLLLTMAVSLLAAELSPEVLNKLDFLLNYGIAEHLELLEQETLMAPPQQSTQTLKTSATVSGVLSQIPGQAVIVSTQTPRVSTTAATGGAK